MTTNTHPINYIKIFTSPRKKKKAKDIKNYLKFKVMHIFKKTMCSKSKYLQALPSAACIIIILFCYSEY